MPQIVQLPTSVVNKIAAGEVVERPASVVKELLENAVDAGARRVDVCVEQGGAAVVRVTDDGCGIAAEQLPLAVASHATSKLRDADDLFRIGTLGFRGEALASIAEVSQFRLRSRTPDGDAGYEVEVTGGQLQDVAPCGGATGTTLEVRNLFYNTPVRRRFLRTTQTEMGHASEAFTRVALAHPQIHFTLRHNDRQLFDLPPTESWRERITTFFGAELNEHLLWVENVDERGRLTGYVADPELSRSNNRMQYLFLNGRFIRDRSLQHALGEAYRGLLTTGRCPVAFLRLDVAPDTVDVNVHPTKLEVRFQDGGRVYSQLLGTLRSKFLSTDLTAKVALTPVAATSQDESSADPNHLAQHRRDVSAWARGSSSSAASEPVMTERQSSLLPASSRSTQAVSPFKPFPAPFGQNVSGSSQPAQLHTGGNPAELLGATSQSPSPASFNRVADTRSASAPAEDGPPIDMPGPHTSSPTQLDLDSNPAPLGLQLHNRYLVTESDEGMVVIDQHALHERILYEQLRQKVLAGQLETQRLLVPEPV